MDAPNNITEQIKEAARNAESKPFTGMENVWDRVAAKLDADESRNKTIPFLNYKKMALAAAALVLIGFGTGYFFSKKTTDHVNMVASHINLDETRLAKTADTIKRIAIVKEKHETTYKNSVKLKRYNTARKENDPISMRDEASGSKSIVQVVSEKKRIEGRIVDDKGEGIPGAEVKLKGSKTGTFTDIDGNYQLEDVVTPSPVIEISTIGYERKEIPIAGDFNLGTTQLIIPANTLSEVVVAQPYGPPVSKSKYTGAADVIRSDKISIVPVSDLTKEIEGAAPGIQVTSGSGQPGASSKIQIRGTGTLKASPAPLIILDGVPYTGNITTINPADVSNITILKDATATSLYGSRGTNGVVVITTKKGVHRKEKWSLKKLFGKKQQVQNVDSLKQ